ncbi:MAG: tail fiber protein [Holosporales bacterium]|jgi:hypothetical protein|nr:tail fiber protein [Holosporales bacterium]
MKDRIPTYPGRVTLTQVTENTYDLVRADAPTEAGTPLTKATLLSDEAANIIWKKERPEDPTVNDAFKELGGRESHEIGDILTTARNLNEKDEWLECDGSEIDAEKYPDLANLFGGPVIPTEWEKKAELTQTLSGNLDSRIEILGNKIIACENGINSDIICRSSTNGAAFTNMGTISTNGGGTQHFTTAGNDQFVILGTKINGFGSVPRRTEATFWYGNTSLSSASLPVPSYSNQQEDYIADCSFGNGYFLACGYTNGINSTSASLIWYGTLPNSMTYKEMYRVTSISETLEYILSVAAGNNQFCCIKSNNTNQTVAVGYCDSPGGTYTFSTSNTFSGTDRNLTGKIRYLNNAWVLTQQNNFTKFLVKTDITSEDAWQTIDPPVTAQGATFNSIEYAGGTYLLTGFLNWEPYSWTCTALTEAWSAVKLTGPGTLSLLSNGVYDGTSWWTICGSFTSAYSYKKTNNTPPNLPLFKPSQGLKTYIKALE